MPSAHDELVKEFTAYAKGARSTEALMEHMALHLHEKMTRYNWTGFYLVDPQDAKFLVVGPYAGSFSPNVRIPLDRGLCGAAATSGKVVVVQDVTRDPRYLAGATTMVKSEIVVPIHVNKKLAAELDIESYFADTFTKPEQQFVESCAALVADFMASH
jgi:L-methionine (R)-S-oxide reductase